MSFDGFEANKIAAAILLALVIGMVSSKVSDILIEPTKLAENVYHVEGVEAGPAGVDVTATGPEPIEGLLANADIERGKKIALKCTQCHTFEKGGPNQIGPNLYNVVGAKVRHVAGYAYSKAFEVITGNWDFKQLNELLYKPAAFARGTKMSFVGLKKTQDRADVIAYLNTLSDSPLPLPAAQTNVEDNKTQDAKQTEDSGQKTEVTQPSEELQKDGKPQGEMANPQAQEHMKQMQEHMGQQGGEHHKEMQEHMGLDKEKKS